MLTVDFDTPRVQSGFSSGAGGTQWPVDFVTTGTSLIRRYQNTATPLKTEDFAVGSRWAGLMSEKLPQGPGAVTFKQDVLRITVATADLARRWLGNLNAAALRSQTFYIVKADGTWTITTQDAGAPETAAVFNRYWRRLSDGRLDMVSSTVSTCNPLSANVTCRVSLQRYWTVLGQQGKTLWVMEMGPNAPTAIEGSWRFVALTDVGAAPP